MSKNAQSLRARLIAKVLFPESDIFEAVPGDVYDNFLDHCDCCGVQQGPRRIFAVRTQNRTRIAEYKVIVLCEDTDACLFRKAVQTGESER